MLGEVVPEGWGWGAERLEAPPPILLAGGDVRLTLDAVVGDYFMDAVIDCSTVALRHLFETLGELGLTLIEDDECEPEWLPGGYVRRYLTPEWGVG